jgi:uncharacterized FAD-dependent dehydrogenase
MSTTSITFTLMCLLLAKIRTLDAFSFMRPQSLGMALKHGKSKSESFLVWRVFECHVPLSEDPGKDNVDFHDKLGEAVRAKVLKSIKAGRGNGGARMEELVFDQDTVNIVRKSFDGRWRRRQSQEPTFVYTVDVTLPREVSIKPAGGKIENIVKGAPPAPAPAPTPVPVPPSAPAPAPAPVPATSQHPPHVTVVGFGPAGLFAALTLVEQGHRVTVVERGQPVEVRGRDIGALVNRRVLLEDSNFCFGEGGAGTWSDGKLTTRIGKNSEEVRHVLEKLVCFGAPERILVDGKPHLGTDRLVRILRSARADLIGQGVDFRFGATVVDVITDTASGATTGVVLKDGSTIEGCVAVVLAIGHSSRPLYEQLHHVRGLDMKAKSIASGFRIEHPQALINSIQYGSEFATLCMNGKGKVPVADYRLVAQVPDEKRAVYSFCMCPGGQIVPTSVNTEELAVNGMSFSRRQSQWANAGLVVTVSPEDYVKDLLAAGEEVATQDPYARGNALVGIQWQRMVEGRAAVAGGGGLVCPVQRITDFMDGRLSVEPLPSSSYRLGCKTARCDNLYSPSITTALRSALRDFDRKLPGYISADGLLHGVESRTSSPVQITRDAVSLQSTSMPRLFPTGEGAGYAGGIVSAAVDGVRVAQAIMGA